MDGEPVWLTVEDVIAVQADQILRYGGLPGIKDVGLVDSAVRAPENHFGYAQERDVLMLALVLCRALAKNHGFVDGNKRTATASMLLFLEVNGYELIVPDDDPDAPWLGRLIENMIVGSLPLANLYAALVTHLREVSDP